MIEKICARFPQVKPYRVIYRVGRAIRSLRGDEVRSRGGQPGNQNAAKPDHEKKQMWSRRFDPATLATIAANAKRRKMSQTAYVAWLVAQDS